MTETKRTLFVLQHTQSEFLGQIEDHLEGRGIGFQYVRPFVSGGKVPGTAALTDGLILLGGGAWGTVGAPLLPSLADEIRLTKDFLNRKRPVVGIGLGAQILCLAAGGGAEAAKLAFEVGEARRVRDDALAGYLPERFACAVYMRDRPVLPEGAEVLAAQHQYVLTPSGGPTHLEDAYRDAVAMKPPPRTLAAIERFLSNGRNRAG